MRPYHFLHQKSCKTLLYLVKIWIDNYVRALIKYNCNFGKDKDTCILRRNSVNACTLILNSNPTYFRLRRQLRINYVEFHRNVHEHVIMCFISRKCWFSYFKTNCYSTIYTYYLIILEFRHKPSRLHFINFKCHLQIFVRWHNSLVYSFQDFKIYHNYSKRSTSHTTKCTSLFYSAKTPNIFHNRPEEWKGSQMRITFYTHLFL